MANPSLRELKRKIYAADDDVSILRKGKRNLDKDRIRRTLKKFEDCDPDVLEERHNRGLKAVSDPTKYFRTFTPPVEVELSDLLNFKNSSKCIPPRTFKCIFNSYEQESKSTDANHDSKDHVSHDSKDHC
ncbi:hypothetical protein A2U01_0023793 [Trifolium medium]|uniref:Uncharacterized protein n=1 Tax=Trifolium medium TaxID=97028 RepID=A0A392NUA2_9FABA|nr:hypothetical protein [Trifolium medium]